MNETRPGPAIPLVGTRVAITGATGFLGGHIAQSLTQAGAELTALSRTASARSRIDFAGVNWIDGDLSREDRLAELASGAAVFVHVAGIINASSPAEFHEVNVEGTRRALRAARSQGVGTFILISSLAAAGPTEPGAPPRREDDPCMPPNDYGRSKRDAEQVLEREGRDFRKWCILRPGTIYGPHDRGYLPFFRLVLRGLRPVLGDGNRIFQPAYGPEVAEACVRALAARNADRRSYFIVARETQTWETFGLTMARILGRRTIAVRIPDFLARPGLFRRFGPTRALANRLSLYLPRRWEADPTRASLELGWRAEIGIEEGLQRTYDWYRCAGWL